MATGLESLVFSNVGTLLISYRGADVDVKRLPKRPAPPRFGRKLTEPKRHALPTYAWIVATSKPFEEQLDTFKRPQCQTPKKRFAGYNPETGRAVGGSTPLPVVLALVVALAVGAALVHGLQ